MRTIKQLMAVVDPSSTTQPAVKRSAWLAEKLGAKLEIFACYYNEYLSGERFFDAPSLEEARQGIIDGYASRIEELAEPLRQSGLSVKTTVVWDHPLHEGIVRHAAETGADLVFKDTHHHSLLSRALLTNTDWNLIRACAVPLWLVKATEITNDPIFIAAIDPMNEHDKPAALDDDILVLSKTLADACGGEVRAFHSFDPRMAIATATANAYIPVSLPFDEIEDQMREQHGKRFNDVIESHNIKKENAHLVVGLTHEELPQLSADLDAAVVVMGAVSRNRWKRIFVGATAERTLDHLPCDLLIVKPSRFETPSEISDERTA